MENQTNRGQDDQNQSLGSAEYRTRLLTKLNCLIAVLEVAIAKITRSIDVPGANEERLMRIRGNLENTLAICNRAKSSLERGSGRPKATPLGSVGTSQDPNKMSYRDYVELTNIDEYTKFKKLPAITDQDLSQLDLDDLSRKLQGL